MKIVKEKLKSFAYTSNLKRYIEDEQLRIYLEEKTSWPDYMLRRKTKKYKFWKKNIDNEYHIIRKELFSLNIKIVPKTR